MIAPGFGGINLEDIAAPRCFEIEARLRESLDIPVFHDDQHGTAIVVLAALTNALRCVEKQLAEVRIVVSGGGAAGTAIVTLLLAAGAKDVVVVDREGALAADDESLSTGPRRAGRRHQPAPGDRRRCARSLVGADVFIGVSRAGHPRRRVDPDHGAQAGRLRPRQPRPGGRPGRGRQVRRRRGLAAAPTTPTRSTTCSPSPASSAACSTRGASEVTVEMLLRAAAGDRRRRRATRSCNPTSSSRRVFHPDVPKAVARRSRASRREPAM